MHKKQILYREVKSQEDSNDQHKGKEERKMRQLEIFWHYHHKEDILDFSYLIPLRQIDPIQWLMKF